MGVSNVFNGVSNNNGPKTPETDKQGNEKVVQNEDPKSSGDSAPQQGEDIVNEQEQDDVVNGQGGDAAEEYIDSANIETKMANKETLSSK